MTEAIDNKGFIVISVSINQIRYLLVDLFRDKYFANIRHATGRARSSKRNVCFCAKHTISTCDKISCSPLEEVLKIGDGR